VKSDHAFRRWLIYTGIVEKTLDNQGMADFYSNKLRFDLLRNQYLLIKDETGDIKDKFKFDGEKLLKVKYRSFESQILNKIKPRNARQELLCDLLDSEIPVVAVSGVAGSGKTFLSTVYALQELQKGKYSKVVLIRNPIAVTGVPELGILPGDATEKLKASCAYVADIITDYMFDLFLQKNQIEIVYLGNMRSRSLSNSFILCNEAQNLSSQLVKMILTRVGEGSRIVFDFDLDQIDRKSFEKDNGMIGLIDALAGHPLFGLVELDRIERSEVARLAALIK
jgi:PhoH-like ATPase